MITLSIHDKRPPSAIAEDGQTTASLKLRLKATVQVFWPKFLVVAISGISSFSLIYLLVDHLVRQYGGRTLV